MSFSQSRRSVPRRVLLGWIRDEEEGARVYRKYGFDDLAGDEEGHARRLRGLLR